MDKNFEMFFPILFVSIWFVVSFMWGILSGWMKISRIYKKPKNLKFKGKWLVSNSFKSGLLFMSGYHRIVMFGVSDEGLFIKMMFLFRIGHPPLFIPWNKITAKRKDAFLGLKKTLLIFEGFDGTPVEISEKFAIKTGALNKITNTYIPMLDDKNNKPLIFSIVTGFVVLACILLFLETQVKIFSDFIQSKRLKQCEGTVIEYTDKKEVKYEYFVNNEKYVNNIYDSKEKLKIDKGYKKIIQYDPKNPSVSFWHDQKRRMNTGIIMLSIWSFFVILMISYGIYISL